MHNVQELTSYMICVSYSLVKSGLTNHMGIMSGIRIMPRMTNVRVYPTAYQKYPQGVNNSKISHVYQLAEQDG